MPDRSPPQILVAVLILLCKWFALVGWVGLTIMDLTLIGAGKDPFAVPLHGLALSGLVAATCVALADWVLTTLSMRFAVAIGALSRRIGALEEALDVTRPLPALRAVGTAAVADPTPVRRATVSPIDPDVIDMASRLQRRVASEEN